MVYTSKGNSNHLYHNNLIPIQPKGSRPPIFWVHGFGGEVIGGAILGRLLGPDQPFYGLQARGVDGIEPPQETIKEMASYYLGAIASIQPHGPYFLGGYCLGGVIAYEIACQLQSMSEKVDLLVLIEASPTPQPKDKRIILKRRTISLFFHNIPAWWRSHWQLGLIKGLAEVYKKGKKKSKDVLIKLGVPIHISVADIIGADAKKLPLSTVQLMELQLKALRSYVPQLYTDRVTLLRVDHLPILKGGDPLLGWSRYARDLEVKTVPGSHSNVLQQPHVRVVAQILRECMDQVLHDNSL